jgi:arylformamidase
MKENQWIDITTTITNAMVTWPGDESVQVFAASSIGKHGSDANVTNLSLSAHTGTHIDAPLHFLPDGKDIAALELDDLIGPVRVIHITDPQQITFTELKEYTIDRGDRVIFRTRNSDTDWTMEPFREDYVYLSTNAAQYLVSLGIKFIGVDYLSVAGMENGTEVHQLLLNEGIVIAEGLNLREVVPGDYDMIALPLKIAGADGAPARVVIRKKAHTATDEEPN